MSAPAPFPRTPEPEECDLELRANMPGFPRAWPSPTATGPIGAGGTITPPAPAEPSPEPHPADARLSDAEAALMAARRNTVNALEWIDRALRDLRKARQS